MTAKTMAEVLEEHTPIGDEVDGVPEDEIWCNKIECGFTMKRTIDYEELRDFATHQSAALSAAGFGLVADAGAKALEDAAGELREWGEERMDCDLAVDLTDVEHGSQNGILDGIGAAERLIRARAATVRGIS